MIQTINSIACVRCRMCERVCPADLFRLKAGKMTITYPDDCCNCLQCKYVCSVDAITFNTVEPKKLDMNGEWAKIKELMGAQDNPMAVQTRRPPWEQRAQSAS